MKIVNTFKDEGVKYPCLMISPKSGGVVLLTSYGTGTLVSPDGISGLGKYSRSWRQGLLIPYGGIVELSN